MKSLLSDPSIRWSLHGAALLFAFALGTLVHRTEVPQPLATASPKSTKVTAPTARPIPSPLIAAAAEAAAPTRAAAPVKNAATAAPNERLSALISYAATLNQPQTITALRKLDTDPDGPATRLARHVLVARFAELDPQTALTYVDTLSGDEHDQQKLSALGTWASKDGRSAAEYFENNVRIGNLASDEAPSAAAAIAAEWAHTDIKAAWTWAANLSEGTRSEAIGRLTSQIAAADPSAAIKAVASLTSEDDRAEAMGPLAAQWAKSAPSQTASWVQSIRQPDEQANAAAGLVSSWMQTDPMSVSSWVSQLPAGATRDSAIAAMVNAQALNNDPEAATRWAATVQDADLRTTLVSQTLQRWNLHDAAAASQWAASNAPR